MLPKLYTKTCCREPRQNYRLGTVINYWAGWALHVLRCQPRSQFLNWYKTFSCLFGFAWQPSNSSMDYQLNVCTTSVTEDEAGSVQRRWFWCSYLLVSEFRWCFTFYMFIILLIRFGLLSKYLLETSKFREFMSPAIIVYFNQRTFQWKRNCQ